jgi:hypothetical protein
MQFRLKIRTEQLDSSINLFLIMEMNKANCIDMYEMIQLILEQVSLTVFYGFLLWYCFVSK